MGWQPIRPPTHMEKTHNKKPPKHLDLTLKNKAKVPNPFIVINLRSQTSVTPFSTIKY